MEPRYYLPRPRSVHLAEETVDAHVRLEGGPLPLEFVHQGRADVSVEGRLRLDAVDLRIAGPAIRRFLQPDALAPEEARLAQHFGDMAAVQPAQEIRLGLRRDPETHDEEKTGLLHLFIRSVCLVPVVADAYVNDQCDIQLGYI